MVRWQRNAAAFDAAPKLGPAPLPLPSALRSCGPPPPKAPCNNLSTAPLDPRARSRSSTPRHTPQTAIHCLPRLGDPYQPPIAEGESHQVSDSDPDYLRPSDSVRLGSRSRIFPRSAAVTRRPLT